MKHIFIVIFLLSFNSLFSFNYAEHEQIGNEAMHRFFFDPRDEKDAMFWKLFPFHYDTATKWLLNNNLSKFEIPIGYGTMNALSGDHVNDPLDLEQQLLTQNGSLMKIILLQNKYKALHYTNAPDLKLVNIDYHYGLFPIFNMCHFYQYELGLEDNLRPFTKISIDEVIDPKLLKKAFRTLNANNAINMYVTIHTAAIYLAEIAGHKAQNNEKDAAKFLHYAFLYNSFADHFLEDCFSGGHLLVRRSVLAAGINNKPIHDFYSKYGTKVINQEEEIWRAYGDNYFNHYHDQYREKDSLNEVEYPKFTEESERIIQAIYLSIKDIKDAFYYAQYYPDAKYSREFIPDYLTVRTNYFMENYKAMQLIPLPYGSKLEHRFPDSVAKDPKVIDANQIPYLRSYIRSRVANSVLIGVNYNYFLKKTNLFLYNSIDIRLNFILLNSLYGYNPKGGKKGRMDIWNGLTFSTSLGRVQNYQEDYNVESHMFKGGFRTNFDMWVTNKRFIGFFMYNEIGLQMRAKQPTFVYAPQIGLQLGSLFNIQYYKMSPWLRIPLQLLLPIKLRFGAAYTPKFSPLYYLGAEMDLFF